MKIRKVAESIVRDLNNLDLRSKTTQKIAYSYKDKQIEIVLNHLREVTNKSNRRDDRCSCSSALPEGYNEHCPIHPQRPPEKTKATAPRYDAIYYAGKKWLDGQ